jgi:uncharacterized protein DUF5916/cellulose/xylan binding protein with CBM9 domain
MRDLARGAALLALSAALLATPAARAQGGVHPAEPPGRNHFTVAPATSPVRVDGVLDEPAWKDATVLPLTHEWFPGDNVAPPVATECLVTFDSENLYVAFRAHDPDPSQIRAYLADRDVPILDDTVGFSVDTFDDHRRAFEFRVNALGVQMDATLSDVDGSEDFSWDAIWSSAGRIGADGYVVEVAVPLKQLRFPRSAGVQTWGFLATRDYPRSLRHQIRSTRIERSFNCVVCQFDALTGFQQIAPGHNVELDPTLTAKRTDERPDLAAPLVTGATKVEAGVSARWGITPNVSLQATINPDFSQVEADAAQLNVNTAFALFFPEKRPFFLEGADFFSTPFQAVFTRTVADPSGGLKLTGKEGPSAFGVFFARDRVNNLIFPGSQSSSATSLDEDVTSGVVRYRRDVGATSTLGVLYTGREASDYSNHVYGLDGSLRLTDSDTLRFQALRSSTEYPGAAVLDTDQPRGTFDGDAWKLDYSHATRNWNVTADFESLDPEFRADSGFIPQVDIQHATAAATRIVWGQPGDWYSRIEWYGGVKGIRDFHGNTTLLGGDFDVTIQGAKQSLFLFGLRPNREFFHGVTYDNFRQDMRMEIRPSGSLGLGLYLRQGPVIDFVNARRVHFYHVEPYGDWKIGRSFSGDFHQTWEVFYLDHGRYLSADLLQTTLRYHLSQRTFFRAILQYLTVERRPSLFNDPAATAPHTHTFFTQLLFSYKVNPQTVLLLGYSDDYANGRQPDGTFVPLTQTDRTFFLKVGYAILW